MRAEISLDTKMFQRAMGRLNGRSSQMAIEAMREAAEEVKVASLKVVPRATDTLANSFFTDFSIQGDDITVSLGYGKGNPMNPKSRVRVNDYVLIVHENLAAKHPGGGQAKFLETPVVEFRERFPAKLAASLRTNIERGGG